MLDFEEVERTIQYAMASGDRDAVHRGLCDLQDAGISDIKLTTRHVTTTGKRFETEVSFPSNKLRVISPGFSKAEKLFFRLMWLKDSARIRKGGNPIHFKHENEMSPEEYAWFKSDEERPCKTIEKNG